jgi:hypothetical protein
MDLVEGFQNIARLGGLRSVTVISPVDQGGRAEKVFQFASNQL